MQKIQLYHVIFFPDLILKCAFITSTGSLASEYISYFYKIIHTESCVLRKTNPKIKFRSFFVW